MFFDLNENIFWFSACAAATAAAVFIGGLTIGTLTMPVTTNQRNEHYSTTGWNFFFKKWWVKQKIRRHKRNRPIVMAAHESLGSNLVEANPEEHMFFGCDHEGNCLLINENSAVGDGEAYLYLKLKDGRSFTLPEYPTTTVINSKTCSDQSRVAALTIECLVPYTKWRLTFNGLLKSPSTVDENDLHHVIFTFFWTAASDPLDLPYSLSSSLLATAVAIETGKSDDLLALLASKFHGHDQFGSMFGQVTINGEKTNEKEIMELNLPGVRQRRWVDIGKESMHRTVTFIGVCKDGNVFVLGAKSFKQHLTHVQFGFLRKANGQILAIDSTDFHLSGFAEENSSLPRAGTVMFRANGEDYLSTIHFHTKSPVMKVFEGRPLAWKTNIATAAISLDTSAGQGICLAGYPMMKSEKRRINRTEPFCDMSNIQLPIGMELDLSQIFISFSEPECRDDELCGGKGASLGILHFLAQRKAQSRHPTFYVPNGFVLTTNAHKLQIARCPELSNAIDAITDVALNRTDGDLADVCKYANGLFKETVVEPEVVQAILSIFDVLQENYINQGNISERPAFRVAVRSSAVCEDGADASSAGQNDTFLGCSTSDEVIQAVKNCWASLYSHHSTSYRHQNMQPIATPMAVVIQTMVPADCAGVLFTRHPVDNDPHKMLVSANYGLGETVVSGSVDPDMYTIQRSYRGNHLYLARKYIGQKSHSIYMHSNGNVEEMETQPDERGEFCLSDDQIIELANVGLFLERFYGNARDIEWAIFNNSIHLLQSRPMTSVKAFTPWELLHEFDTAIMSPEDVSTFGNIGEVLPEVITPLTQSTFGRVLEKNMCKNVLRRDSSPFYASICRISHYRMAFEVYNMFLQAVEKDITLENRMYGLIVFGHDFISDDIHRIALKRNGVATTRKTLPIMWDVLKSLFANRRKCDDLQKFTDQFVGTYDPSNLKKFRTALELFIDLKAKVHQMEYPATVHGSTSKTSSVYQIIALTILAENNKDLTIEHSIDIAVMLSSCKDIESADIPKQLYEITHEIRATNNAESFSSLDPCAGVKWLEENCESAHQLLQNFLAKHSHRTYKEFELATDTWGMRPELVIAMLQSSTKHPEVLPKAQPTKSNEEIVAELTSPKRSITRRCIKWILPYCKSSVQIREKSKSNFIAYVHEIRKGFRHLGQMMHSEGFLPSEDIIYYLTQLEIEAVLVRTSSDVIMKAGRRKRLFNEWKKCRFNEMQFGIIRPIEDEAVTAVGGDCVRVTGTPVCQGVISGRACVLKTFDEVVKIQPGDILVTHSTDIGWSPYFPILGGVVTELGGLISHGAVVAREYGLPCIVGATGATDKITFGDQIQMDANVGVIIKLE